MPILSCLSFLPRPSLYLLPTGHCLPPLFQPLSPIQDFACSNFFTLACFFFCPCALSSLLISFLLSVFFRFFFPLSIPLRFNQATFAVTTFDFRLFFLFFFFSYILFSRLMWNDS